MLLQWKRAQRKILVTPLCPVRYGACARKCACGRIGKGIKIPGIFNKIDKIKPAYDATYQSVMFLCKLLLVVDILITTMSVIGRYVPFIPDPAWSEEVVLTCMSYMAVLSAALAIRRGAHIRMTAFDSYLPKNVVKFLDLLSDAAVLALALIMIFVGWKYARGIGSKGSYVSMPKISRFWMYFPVPLAGVAMLIFELEAVYNHIKSFFVKEADQS